MKANHSHIVLLLPLLANAAALHMLFLLFAQPGVPNADHAGLLIWWGCITAAHFSLAAFLRKPRELRNIVLLTALFPAVQLALTLYLAEGYPTFITWGIALFMWIGLYYRMVVNLQEGAKPESLTLTFEGCAIALLITAALTPGGTLSGHLMIHLVIALIFSLIAQGVLRSGHTRLDQDSTSRKKGGLLLTLLIAALGGVAALVCALTTDAAAALLKRFTQWLLSVMQAFGRAVTDFFTWLFSLFASEPEHVIGDSAVVDGLPHLPPEETATENGIILYILIAALLVGALVLLTRMWRTAKLHRAPAKARTARAVPRTGDGLWALFRRFLRKIAARVRFELRYLRSRSTPPGLLIWLERKMKRRRKGRRIGETHAAFLRRIAEEYHDCAEDLEALSRNLDALYFGNTEEISFDSAPDLRKRLRNAIKHTEQSPSKTDCA